MVIQRPVVGFCEFVGLSAFGDLVRLAHTADRCAAEAASVLGRHGGSSERVLYDRLLALFASPLGAVDAFVELGEAIAALGVGLAVGLAEGDGFRWGRGHLVARALSQAAGPGELLLDERLRSRLGQVVRCEWAGEHEGVPAWRVRKRGLPLTRARDRPDVAPRRAS
jgi:class 3 adenylate cyclase